MSYLAIDLRVLGDDLGDVATKKLAEAAAQTVDRHLDGALVHLQFLRQLSVGRPRPVFGQESLEAIELSQPVRFHRFSAQRRQNLLDHRQGPASLEDLLGSEMVDGVDLVAALRSLDIERDRCRTTAALQRSSLVTLVGQKVLRLER